MARRTREADAELIETVDDLEELVQDKRQSWRANASKQDADKGGIKIASLMNLQEWILGQLGK